MILQVRKILIIQSAKVSIKRLLCFGVIVSIGVEIIMMYACNKPNSEEYSIRAYDCL